MNGAGQWSRATKQLVAATLIVLTGLLLYNFRSILIPIIIVCLLAYILAPVVGWLSRGMRIKRGWAVLLVYVTGLAAVAVLPAITIPIIVTEVENLIENLDAIINDAVAWLFQFDEYQLRILGYVITLPDFDTILPEGSFDLERIVGLINSAISPIAGGAFSVIRTVASGIGLVIVIAVMSFYLLVDAERLRPAFLGLIPAPYCREAEKLLAQINGVWSAFLRGQLVLSIVIGVMTATAMSIVGIRFSLALGIVAGVLEVVPSLGPTLAAIPAVLLALFQGSTYIGWSNLTVAFLVAGIYIVIQSIENNLLVPRILGGNLKLHPIAVIMGVLAGFTAAGIIGALLAAPVLATARYILRYIYYKMIDADPYPEPLSFREQVRVQGIRAILFDLDGTLIETDDMLVELWGRRLGRIPLLHKLYDGEKLARVWVMRLESPLNALLTVIDWLNLDERFFRLVAWIQRLYGGRPPAQYVVVNGTVEMIKNLSRRYDLAVTTTRSREDALAFIEQYDLFDHFKVIVTRDDVRRLKPHREPVETSARLLGYPPAQCLMVGDTTVDIISGSRAGAMTAAVLCGLGERPELEKQEPNIVLNCTSDLESYMMDPEPAGLERL